MADGPGGGWPLAFSTLGCPDEGPEWIAALARSAGCTGVELRCSREEGPFALERTGAERAAAAALLRAAGVEKLWVASYLRVADNSRTDADYEAELAEVIAAAVDIGAAAVRVFCGAPEPGPAADALAAHRLSLAAERAHAAGIRVLLETHDSHPRGADVARVLRRCAHPAAGAVWDVLHPWRHGETPDQTAHHLGRWLEHVQLKDAASAHDLHPLPLGHGAVPLAEVLRTLIHLGYTGRLSLEWERRWYPDAAPLAEVLPQAAAWLARHTPRTSPADTSPADLV
ncbi:sugar phosphate isomerase/epimerase [Actinospica durhamensis]|uniref:Sugar phosphate isomerase/epimerase n=1 Tax=Actinospica durhamensis TaxID=1508375 RepID=A0A941EY48_9ACTN|nr:sugar phosphate isomerase/epimerase family protein [Actinospica durhamensis]MBR7838492.1 sugar phosphate isomerase/epimerase [Actinospica durhamensis]